jgi:hypothetical protein
VKGAGNVLPLSVPILVPKSESFRLTTKSHHESSRLLLSSCKS